VLPASPALRAADGPHVERRQETYKQVGGVTLTIDIFEPKRRDPGKEYPAVVFFFGGGWVGGSSSKFHPHCEYLAGRGMIAMSAEYRVKSRQGTAPSECVKDGKSVVRWIRAHARPLPTGIRRHRGRRRRSFRVSADHCSLRGIFSATWASGTFIPRRPRTITASTSTFRRRPTVAGVPGRGCRPGTATSGRSMPQSLRSTETGSKRGKRARTGKRGGNGGETGSETGKRGRETGNGVGSHLCRFAASCDRSPVGTEAFWAARGA
jgi:hypothetical protein